jgi:hypothetical protein
MSLFAYFFQTLLYTLAHALPYIAVVLLAKAAYRFVFER